MGGRMGRPRIGHEEDEKGCWIWQGELQPPHGYARTEVRRRYYEEAVGPVPLGLELDHLCRKPSCVNPAHMEPVTRQENERRKYLTGCRKGHPWTEATEYRSPVSGWRNCRICNRDRSKQFRERRRVLSNAAAQGLTRRKEAA